MGCREAATGTARTWLADAATNPRALYGAALLRIGYGIAGLAYYVTNYEDRRYLWGPGAVFPFDAFTDSMVRPAFSVYEFSSSPWLFELLFHLGLVVSVLFTLGIGGRFMTLAHYVLLWSLYSRNPLLLDGGDNIAFLVLLYLIPVHTNAVLAVRMRPVPSDRPSVSTLLHNAGLAFIVTQLCVVYLASAMYKIRGQFWQDGTALYYVLRVPEYSWPVLTDHLYPYAWFITLATYATVFYQLLFPTLLMRPATRVLAVLLGVMFHAGIALFMGLTAFSLYMVATEAVILPDRHYRRVGAASRRVFTRPPRDVSLAS